MYKYRLRYYKPGKHYNYLFDSEMDMRDWVREFCENAKTVKMDLIDATTFPAKIIQTF